MRVDRLDLLQLHRIDPRVPFADQIGALRQLRDDGVARHVGLSEVSVAQIAAAREITPIASVQNLYNLTDRRHEDVLDHCAAEGIAFIPWLPIANGTHATRTGPLADVAAELDATPTQVALAWLLHRSPAMIPIPGTSSLAHLTENAAAGGPTLRPDRYDRLDQLARTPALR